MVSKESLREQLAKAKSPRQERRLQRRLEKKLAYFPDEEPQVPAAPSEPEAASVKEEQPKRKTRQASKKKE